MESKTEQEIRDWKNMELHFRAAASGFTGVSVTGFKMEYQDAIVTRELHKVFERYADLCAKAGKIAKLASECQRAETAYAKWCDAGGAQGAVTHGVDCPKVNHAATGGYSHGDLEDGPYWVDGVKYCGRCHVFLTI